jgi:hypothetical protein
MTKKRKRNKTARQKRASTARAEQGSWKKLDALDRKLDKRNRERLDALALKLENNQTMGRELAKLDALALRLEKQEELVASLTRKVQELTELQTSNPGLKRKQ